MLKEFKAFLLRGNVFELAVAIIIGIAFGGVVNAFTNGVLMQLIAAIFGKPDFAALKFTIGQGTIYYGAFINSVINFVIVGAALFLTMRAMTRMMPPKEAPSETKACSFCKTDIPVEASRCPNCTSQLAPA